MIMRRKTVGLGIFAAITFCGRWAGAAPLPVGGNLYPAPAVPGIGGATLVASITDPVAAATFTGTLTSSVYVNDPANPGGLTFTYLLSNNGPNANERLTVSKFTGFLTDAGYVTGAGVVPTLIDRTTADVVGFDFDPTPLGLGVIGTGQSGDLLIVRTNATSSQPSTASVIDGSVATVPTFAPLSVPEPAALGMLACGAIGLLARRRRA